jgi:hypothetical protein
VECGFGSGWVRKSKSLPFGFALSKIPTSGKIGQKWGTRFIAFGWAHRRKPCRTQRDKGRAPDVFVARSSYLNLVD